jgi:hypothetical protein
MQQQDHQDRFKFDSGPPDDPLPAVPMMAGVTFMPTFY